MQTIDNYVQDSHIRLLLQGPPGSGKSTLACQFPGAYIIDCDVNLAGPLRWLKKHNKKSPVGFDNIAHDEKGTVEPKNRLARLMGCINNALKEPEVKTIVIDSATSVAEAIQYKVLQSNQELTSPTKPQWGEIGRYWRYLVGTLVANPKHIVLTAHEQVDDTGTRYTVAIPGGFKNIAGALFTDVWRCEAHTLRNGDKILTKYVVRTVPDLIYALKNSLDLDPVLEFDWTKVEASLS